MEHCSWVCQPCQTTQPRHCQVGKADRQRFMERAGPGWRSVSPQGVIPSPLLPAHIWAAYIECQALRPRGAASPAVPPPPLPPSTQPLLSAAGRPGTRPSCLSLFPRPPLLGTTLPSSSVYFLSELLRGFPLKAMKRNLLTGGSILSWVCTGAKRKAWGGEGEADGGRMRRMRHSSRTSGIPFKQLHQQMALPNASL